MQKVSPGQPLRIPASTFNAMIDAAQDFQRRSINRQSEDVVSDKRTGIVAIRNASGANRNRFDVLGISGVLITPSQNAQEFASRWAFTGVLPAATHLGKLVVLQEPLKANAIGRGLMLGITPANIKRPTGDNSEFCGVRAGQVHLETGISGAQILWEDTFAGEAIHLALVRMPAIMDSAPIRMRVSSILGDYIVCNRWTGTQFSTVNENVAKPYQLRNSITSRNGITYTYTNGFTRTARKGSATETQVIVPSFVGGVDEILAAPVASTGVTVSSKELTLIDLNVDGRAWAKQ